MAVLKLLLLPPGILLILLLAGLLAMRRWRKTARATLVVGWLALYLLSSPLVSAWLQSSAGTSQAVSPQDLRSGQAIVILGGGLRLHATEYGGADTLGGLTVDRVRYGARLARSTGLPVLVTGGRPQGAQHAEAEVMRDALEQEFGVPVRWVEKESRNTAQNARKSADILLPFGVKRIVLVMHGFDAGRATTEFTEAGFEVIAAPTLLARPGLHGLVDVLPQAGALLGSYYALYEMVAIAARPLRSADQ